MRLNPPAFLVVSTTFLVFAVLILLFFKTIPNAVENVLFTLIGGIIAKWGTIVDYNFGSSAGSKAKTDILNELAGTGDGSTVTTKAKITTEKVTTVDTPPVDTPKEPQP
jgi:hypothetical protein